MMSITDILYNGSMSRWQSDAQQRLAQAALTLYLERGFERTTVAEIAAHVGLTERTFFRHFSDKREVLFGSSNQLQALVVSAIMQAHKSATPIQAVAVGLEVLGELFAPRLEWSRQRQAVINQTPELQARELTKFNSLAHGIAEALQQRGINEFTASLSAEIGIVIFRAVFERYINPSNQKSWTHLLEESLEQVKTIMAGLNNRLPDVVGAKRRR